MFYRTSHAVVLKDGSARQYCSIRCLAMDMTHIEQLIDKTLVVDAGSGELIPVQNAVYVVESDVPGTMSRVSKLAFADKGNGVVFPERARWASHDFR